uniref:Cytosine-specific methyltransferase n=1 Tax=Acetobacter pasteurianus subsp. pasteurianus TaxID=481145 RepID=E3VXA0_ACEPA|nr:M.ApaI [Acetobacter pasteurianus subsp. pasteurianus]
MKALDLFSGPGGLSLGMKHAGIEPVACVEKNKDAVSTYDAHTPDAEHYCSDIRSISFERYRGLVDIVFGGPPCQPFSTGGLRRGTADARNMFPEFMRVLKEVRPAAFLAENVPGLATRNRVQYLAELLNEFEALGFNVSWNVVSAADYGVPQKRRRLIIVGMKKGTFWFPKPTHGPDTNIPHVASGRVIDKACRLEPPDCPVIYAKCPDPRRSPYAGHVYNGGGRPIDLSAPCHTLLASAGGYKTHWIDTMDIAPDYSAHLMAGGAPRDGAVPGARRMTLEESALIQTFPADMWFAGSRSSQYTQVGDAVPPMLAHALGAALRRQLEGSSVCPTTHYQTKATLPLLVAA